MNSKSRFFFLVILFLFFQLKFSSNSNLVRADIPTELRKPAL